MDSKKLVCILALGTAISTAQAQEIKKEVRGEQEYAVYKVQKGETVFSIAKKYGISQDKFVESNPAVAQVIKANDIVYIPLKNKAKEMANIYKNANEQQPDEVTSIQYTKHKVAKGQGLMAIARMYNITFEELKKWNDLEGDSPKIVPDQELIVGIATSKSSKKNNETPKNAVAVNNKSIDRDNNKPAIKKTDNNNGKSRGEENIVMHEVASGETLYKISKMYGLTEVEIMNENNLTSNTVKAKEKLKIVNPKKMPSAPADVVLTHEVAENETLAKIAEMYGLDELDIMNENNLENSAVRMKDKLRIVNPKKTPTAEKPATNPENPAKTEEPAFVIYTIQQGDNLNKIQEKFNVRRTEIRYWNGMEYEEGGESNKNTIIAGEVLRIYPPKRIEHTIQAGETIESVQKKYNLIASHTPLEKWNNIPKTKLKEYFKAGKTLLILQPTGPAVPEGFKEGKVLPMPSLVQPTHTQPAPEKQPSTVDISQMDKKSYTVKGGQTLYQIATMHGAKTDDLKKWNGLASENLSEGQVLTVYVAKGTNAQPANTNTNTNSKPAQPNGNNTTPATKDNNFKGDNNNMDLGNMEDLLTPNTTPKKEESKKEEPKKEEPKAEEPKKEESKKEEPKTDNGVMRGDAPSEVMKGIGETNANAYKDPNASANLAGSGEESNLPKPLDVIEKGEAELLETLNSEYQLVGTHKNLPTGTNIFVTNTINKKTVLVQIVEPMQSNVQPNTIMQVTRAVLDKLGAGDAKSVSVEIKYAKK
ncbi:MAG: LysM peptidoglycan-binding domain-containing protein [Bacteroidetes bacterium]|nr:MAG: LysM peptidoglycan-binding domain-containing protein [Bacteroidota bacterium]